MDRKVDGAAEIAMQQLMETHVPIRDVAEEAIDRMAEGKSPMQALFEAMLNAIMPIERERHLEACPHERASATPTRGGHDLIRQVKRGSQAKRWKMRVRRERVCSQRIYPPSYSPDN